MKISVIGIGYVGTVTGACFARLGHEVVLIDSDVRKVKAMKSRATPIFEEGLDELLSQVSIDVTLDYQKIRGSEVIFICVGTPSNKDGSLSLAQVKETGADKRSAGNQR